MTVPLSARSGLRLFGVSLFALGCISHTPATHEDTGTTNDGALAIDDAGSVDAFTPAVDAFVMPIPDAGRDAFVAPIDAASPCTPLPTTTPLVIDGAIATGPTYDRPTAACASLSRVGTAVFYATHVFCNHGATRSFSFELDAAASGGIVDPFLTVYAGAGDVSALMCLASDDDSAPTASGKDSLAVASVPGGATITVVPSTYDNGVTGDYVLTIVPL